ncbi:MAG: rod shape-determining protein RodA [Paludibacteraceae bacterium]|nr:rod shape-determining protein RodA [Paludibacteraceae bacterium]
MTRNSIISGIDWWTIILFLTIALFGWLNIYGASYTFDQTSVFDLSNRAGKQFLWLGIACVLGIAVLFIEGRTYEVIAYLLYAFWIIVLLITPLLAHNVKGSMSWIDIGPIKFQPAELAKMITALALAKYMGRYEYRVRSWRDLLTPSLLLALPAIIIMVWQRETGSALVFASFMLMFYRFGMSGYVITGGLSFALLFICSIRFGEVALPWGEGNVGILLCYLALMAVLVGFAWLHEQDWKNVLVLVGIVVLTYAAGLIINIWYTVNFNIVSLIALLLAMTYFTAIVIYRRHFSMLLVTAYIAIALVFCEGCTMVFNKVLQPHQRTRIEVLLGLKDDPTGAGYNVNQSLIAIGSGQFSGKGFLKGTQTKLRFVPEQDTDFIFCTVGEEWGFLGSAGLLIAYLCFIIRLIVIAERQRDNFSRIYAYCVAGIFFFHLTINIGMVLGLLPVIGIPLPFFSYGGSSLISFTMLLAVLLRLDAERLNKLH